MPVLNYKKPGYQEQGETNTKNRYVEMIFSSWNSGSGSMPSKLGMQPEQFGCFLDYFGFQKNWKYHHSHHPCANDRQEEVEDLYAILMKNRTSGSETESWIALLVAIGCMSNDHLWSDLGLSKRSDLTQMLMENFYPLAKKNNWDMKWKKFLYRQLCDSKRGTLCRSPTCEECTDYDACYSVESVSA